MRIGLYGLPTAGKTFILDTVKNLNVLQGSDLLKEMAPDFHFLSSEKKMCVRKQLAVNLKQKDNFIMDGHYAFGHEVVFTEEDGELYDTILYLYIEPSILKMRMKNSIKNKKYLAFDIEQWQKFEIDALREYCHKNNKDFYVLDNPDKGYFEDVSIILEFINAILEGYSCFKYAQKCTYSILSKIKAKEICLADGDKTLIMEDSSRILGYKTHIFDGNFYTGFQSWKHTKEIIEFLHRINWTSCLYEELDIHFNNLVLEKITMPCVILTSGYYGIWKEIANKLNVNGIDLIYLCEKNFVTN